MGLLSVLMAKRITTRIKKEPQRLKLLKRLKRFCHTTTIRSILDGLYPFFKNSKLYLINNNVLRKLLQLTGTQLFLVMFAIFLILAAIMMLQYGMSGLFFLFSGTFLLKFYIVLIIFYFIWLFAIAKELPFLLPDDVKIPVQFLKYSLWIPIVILSLFLLVEFLANVFPSLDWENTMIYVFAILYGIYMIVTLIDVLLIARLVGAVEQQQKPTVSNIFGNLLLLIIFPIGIFVLQPKINSFFER